MKTLLTMTAAMTLAAGMAQAETVVTTTTTTPVQTIETDHGTTGAGATGGAASGAIAGAVVGGPVGAVVGGVIGAVAGDVSEDALTPETRTYILENRTESYALQGDVVVGAAVPETVEIQAVPNTPYQYVYVNETPVLVDPATRQVIYVYE